MFARSIDTQEKSASFWPFQSLQDSVHMTVERAFKASSLHHADLDDTMLGKPGRLKTSPGQRSLGPSSRNLLAAPHAGTTLHAPRSVLRMPPVASQRTAHSLKGGVVPNGAKYHLLTPLQGNADRRAIQTKATTESTSQLRKSKTVEQIYQKKTQLEHILLRPDTYVGSIEYQNAEMFVVDESKQEIVLRRIEYVPALYKIFDEILVNAADNLQRDPKMDLIDVTIDKAAGSISVMNTGRGVPIHVHKEYNVYVPELIFGHLLTSDNYDDNEKKVTGGRNGYGAKLTNVFSKKFIIETVDKQVKKKFTQVFEDNMSKKSPPKVEDCSEDSYTRVTFWPDFPRFGMSKLDDDIVGLMLKRVYDLAGVTRKSCKVNLQGKTLQVEDFQDYVNLYLANAANPVASEAGAALPCIYEKSDDRWEVGVSITDGSFQQISFVNAINTHKGGTHVTHIEKQLVEAILKVVKNKNKGGIEIKPQHVRNHLWIFVNCLIENPTFDSQTKETMTLKDSKFGSRCELSDKFIKQVMQSGVVDLILDWAKAKQQVDLGNALKVKHNVARILGIPQLEDANDAGGKRSQNCTLIVTEGDSAKALAVAGLSFVGRDRYGVFPLRGKMLNVRDANFQQLKDNREIQNLLKILGLDFNRQYQSTEGLRYGSVMIMADQDYDGSHIKGLLINFIHHWWPNLVIADGFLKEFITPRHGDRQTALRHNRLAEPPSYLALAFS